MPLARAKAVKIRLLLVLVLLLVVSSIDLAGLVGGDLVLDPLPSLLPVELVLLPRRRLLGPLGGVFLGWLELWVLSDGGVGARVHLLDVLGTNVVSEVGGELLLESEKSMISDRKRRAYSTKTHRSSSSSSSDSMYSAT